MPKSRLRVGILLTSTLVLLRRGPSCLPQPADLAGRYVLHRQRRTPSLTRGNRRPCRFLSCCKDSLGRFFISPDRLSGQMRAFENDPGPSVGWRLARVMLVVAGVVAAVTIAFSSGAVKIPGLSGGSRKTQASDQATLAAQRTAADKQWASATCTSILDWKNEIQRDGTSLNLEPRSDHAHPRRDQRDHPPAEPARHARAPAGRADGADAGRAESAPRRDHVAAEQPQGRRRQRRRREPRRDRHAARRPRERQGPRHPRSAANSSTSCRSISASLSPRRARAGSSSASPSDPPRAGTVASWSATCSARRSRAAAPSRSPASTATAAAAPGQAISAATRSAPSSAPSSSSISGASATT